MKFIVELQHKSQLALSSSRGWLIGVRSLSSQGSAFPIRASGIIVEAQTNRQFVAINANKILMMQNWLKQKSYR